MSMIVCTVSNGDLQAEVQLPASLIYQLGINQWMANHGDRELLWKQKIHAESTVVEVGGFTGQWADVIHRKYDPHLYVLEPVRGFYEELHKKFQGKPKVRTFNFGLGPAGSYEFSVEGAASSVYQTATPSSLERVELKSFDTFFEENQLKQIDLLQINIEGGEYALLEQIITSRYRTAIIKMQIQFHLNVEDAPLKRDRLRKALSETHSEVFSVPFVWEAWDLTAR